MTKSTHYIFIILGFALLSRLLAIYSLPLIETTEPRYAEIARIMAETGDWITPWFNYDVPFWGKPPLSFWCQAFSINLFGENEFAVRFPSLLVTLMVLALIYRISKRLSNQQTGLWSVLIYSTCALSYVLAGAVLTDPFLTLATTLALASVVEVSAATHSTSETRWGYGLFFAIVIGLLAKGPIAVILLGTPIFVWLVLDFKNRIRLFPWLSGTLLTLALTLPWYIAAELKTPGFIQYFIIGEHFLRFLDPGWGGDLYGSAHRYPHGTIWVFAVWASFPWGLVAIFMLVAKLKKEGLTSLKLSFKENNGLLVMWMLWPLVFFTLAGNILWTYVQPALPAFAILLALAIGKWVGSNKKYTNVGFALASLLPVVGVAATIISQNNDWVNQQKTEKNLISYVSAMQENSDDDSVLYYVGELPFSARFYTAGKVRSIDENQIDSLFNQTEDQNVFLAAPKKWVKREKLTEKWHLSPIFTDRRYSLFDLSQNSQVAVNASAGGNKNDVYNGE